MKKDLNAAMRESIREMKKKDNLEEDLLAIAMKESMQLAKEQQVQNLAAQ